MKDINGQTHHQGKKQVARQRTPGHRSAKLQRKAHTNHDGQLSQGSAKHIDTAPDKLGRKDPLSRNNGFQQLKGLTLMLHVTETGSHHCGDHRHDDTVEHRKLIEKKQPALSQVIGILVGNSPARPEQLNRHHHRHHQPDLAAFCF